MKIGVKKHGNRWKNRIQGIDKKVEMVNKELKEDYTGTRKDKSLVRSWQDFRG